jgi:hypothetical protein
LKAPNSSSLRGLKPSGRLRFFIAIPSCRSGVGRDRIGRQRRREARKHWSREEEEVGFSEVGFTIANT